MIRLVSLLLECKIIRMQQLFNAEKRARKVADPSVAAYQVSSFIAAGCRLWRCISCFFDAEFMDISIDGQSGK